MAIDLLAKQANKLIESVYRMDTNEQKLILLATKIVNDLELKNIPFNSETEIIITANDFAKTYGISKQRAFEFVCEAKNTIYERSFEIDYIDAQGQVKPTSSRWIHRKGEMKSKSEISLFFAPAVIPYIYLVKKEFTLLDLREVGRLKSKYAIRLYKLLMKWRNFKYQPNFKYEDLRDYLGLEEEEYPMKTDFRKRVLDIAVNQINLGTGFVNLKYTGVKKGKTITNFLFSYDKYDNDTLNVTPISDKKPPRSKKAISDTPQAETSETERTGENKRIVSVEGAKPKKAQRHFDFGMTTPQASMFASKIVKKILEQDSRFMHLSELAPEGGTGDDFKVFLVQEFLTGNLAPYQAALSLLGYKHHQ